MTRSSSSSQALKKLDNTAAVSWPEQTLRDDGSLAAGPADFTFSDIKFTANLIDNCAPVTDTFHGLLGTTCVGEENPTSYT